MPQTLPHLLMTISLFIIHSEIHFGIYYYPCKSDCSREIFNLNFFTNIQRDRNYKRRFPMNWSIHSIKWNANFRFAFFLSLIFPLCHRRKKTSLRVWFYRLISQSTVGGERFFLSSFARAIIIIILSILLLFLQPLQHLLFADFFLWLLCYVNQIELRNGIERMQTRFHSALV